MTGGVINQNGWGVCGFVGVLNALHQRGKLKSFDRSLTVDQVHERLEAEILTYFKLTKVEKPDLAKKILSFTQSFGEPYKSYADLDVVIDHFKMTYSGVRPTALGVALPAEAIVDYARSAGLGASIQALSSHAYDRPTLLGLAGCVVGVGDGSDAGNEWRGLKHWIYVTPDGHLLNWGDDIDLKGSTALPGDFKSVTDAVKLS